MDDVDYGELLFALIGELAARELSLKLARQCRLAPEGVVADGAYEIPADFDLCAHLPLDVSGRRGALLMKSSQAKLLVSEAQRRGTLARDGRSESGDRHVPLASLLAEILARPCALLGFLGGEGLHLRGVTVQDTDTPVRRTAHQIAFRRQEMVQGRLRLEAHGLTPMAFVLLLPDALFGAAAVSLTDPEHLRVTDDLFLEHAPAVGREVEAWVEEQMAGEEEEASGPFEAGGPPEPPQPDAGASSPEVTALADLLEEVLEGLPGGEEDVVLQSPEDLIFAQLFFPQMLAHWSRQAVGRTLRVRAVEMASLALTSMSEEPAGLLAQIVFQGGFEGDTCLVFPEDSMTALARQFGCAPNTLVQLLTTPGLAFMESIAPSLKGEARPPVRVDFSGYRADGGQYTLRIRYEMFVEGQQEPIPFVQYASPVFVNRLVGALAGEDTEFLKANKRNLMLSFLSLNALIGAVAVEDPDRAAEWIGPILGGEYVPLYRPGDELPDMYDFDVLAELPRSALEVLFTWPALAGVDSRVVAPALRHTAAATRRMILEAGPKVWRQRVPELDRSRESWSPKEVWEARQRFAEMLHGGVANSGIEPTVAVAQQLGWRKHRLILAWRLRGPEVLEDGIFIVPFMLEFDTLATLSNRDMAVVLERWVSGRLDLDTLGCALSRPHCPVLPRVLGNVSARRRQEIAAAAQRERPPEEAFGAQHFFAEHVYFAALKGIIDPPRVIGEQIDRYLVLVDGELDEWCGAVLRDPTFSRLLAQLEPRELGDVQRLVGREEVLWGLVDAPEATVSLFLQWQGGDAESSFQEDLEIIGRREDSPQRRAWRMVEARLLAIDAARLVLRTRSAGGRQRRS